MANLFDSNVNRNDNGTIEIGVKEPIEFSSNEKLMVTTSIDLADLVSQFFSQTLTDYYGCKICRSGTSSTLPDVAAIYPQGSIYVDLYFKYDPADHGAEDKAEVLIPRVPPVGTQNDKKEKTLEERMLAINALAKTTSLYAIHNDVKKALAPYMVRGLQTNWPGITKEIAQPINAQGKDDTIVCISGVDIGAVIANIYGATEKNPDTARNDAIEYHISVGKNLPTRNDEFIVEIKRYNTKSFKELQVKLGLAMQNNTNFHVWSGR